MSSYRPLSAVVLAAGEGTRMRSATPKVLHPLCGRPMLLHVLDALVQLPIERVVVVVGRGAEAVTKTVQELEAKFLSEARDGFVKAAANILTCTK